MGHHLKTYFSFYKVMHHLLAEDGHLTFYKLLCKYHHCLVCARLMCFH